MAYEALFPLDRCGYGHRSGAEESSSASMPVFSALNALPPMPKNRWKGIIIADKGFPPSRIGRELAERPGLHFLTPVKRNDRRIEANGMLGFDQVLSGYDSRVAARKQALRGGRFLYSFRDAGKAAAEEASFLKRAREEGALDKDGYAKASRLFGVIVFESDLDMECQTAYECYEGRWKLELVFRRYKDDECLDRTGVQGDFSVIGQEFVNFISTLMTLRMLERARKAHLLEDRTYGELMDNLSSAWRKVDAPEGAKSDDGFWVHAFSYVLEELEALGLSEPAPKPEPRKRGRPRKNPAEPDKPKRPRKNIEEKECL